MSLDAFLWSAEVLENITKWSDGCNKCFHNFIYILCNINASRFTLHFWRAIWYMIRKTSNHKPIGYSKFRRFLLCSMWWSHRSFSMLTDSIATLTNILWTCLQQHSRKSGYMVLFNEVFMKRFTIEFFVALYSQPITVFLDTRHSDSGNLGITSHNETITNQTHQWFMWCICCICHVSISDVQCFCC